MIIKCLLELCSCGCVTSPLPVSPLDSFFLTMANKALRMMDLRRRFPFAIRFPSKYPSSSFCSDTPTLFSHFFAGQSKDGFNLTCKYRI